jgi:TonB family protein
MALVVGALSVGLMGQARNDFTGNWKAKRTPVAHSAPVFQAPPVIDQLPLVSAGNEGPSAPNVTIYKDSDLKTTDSRPRVLAEVEPHYSADALSSGLQGFVTFRMVVGTDGLAHDVQILKTLDPVLDRNAREALNGWRFKPATKDGNPINIWATVRMDFRITINGERVQMPASSDPLIGRSSAEVEEQLDHPSVSDFQPKN